MLTARVHRRETRTGVWYYPAVFDTSTKREHYLGKVPDRELALALTARVLEVAEHPERARARVDAVPRNGDGWRPIADVVPSWRDLDVDPTVRPRRSTCLECGGPFDGGAALAGQRFCSRRCERRANARRARRRRGASDRIGRPPGS